MTDWSKAEHKESAEGIWEVGVVYKKTILQGSETGATPLWKGDLGTLCRNGEEGRGHTHGVSETNHGEAGAS